MRKNLRVGPDSTLETHGGPRIIDAPAKFLDPGPFGPYMNIHLTRRRRNHTAAEIHSSRFSHRQRNPTVRAQWAANVAQLSTPFKKGN